MEKLLLGFVIGAGIAALAYLARALNRSGAVAAGILGTIVFGLGGVGWAVVLLTFFISASALSKTLDAKKSEINQNFAKGSRRDAGQVLANGGVGGALVLLYVLVKFIQPNSEWLPLLWLGFAASFAGANADTWATELGVLNPRNPVLLRTFRRVPRGTSGAISLVGTLSALAGSALVAGAAALSTGLGWTPSVGVPLWQQFGVIAFAGWLGAWVDSFLGATFQALYFCPRCEKQTERHPLHGCGAKTYRQRGLRWLNNDWVNAVCTLSAALIVVLFGGLFV